MSDASRLLDAVPPAAGGTVMGTGIVSTGLALDHRLLLSRILLAVGLALWLGLAAVLARRALRQRPRWLEDARTPGILTAVAGTTVLGARLTLLGADPAGYALLAVAACLWLCLVGPVLRHWTTPSVGVSFVLAVATESLAVLSALLATQQRLAWLAAAALCPFLLGLAAYAFVLVRVDLRELVTGAGDQWIYGGALAIATLACARTTAALDATATLTVLHGALSTTTLALWAAAACWLPALIAGELARPRLRYDTRRWSTVFPLGMYAVCSIAAGSVAGVGGLAAFGRVSLWLALAAWTAALAGMLRRGATLVRAAGDRRV